MLTLIDPGTFLSQNPAESALWQQDHSILLLPLASRSIPPREPDDTIFTGFFEPEDDEDDDIDEPPYSRSTSSDDEEEEAQERCYPPDEPDSDAIREVEQAQAAFRKLLQLHAYYAQANLSEEEIIARINADMAEEHITVDRLPANWKEVE